MGRRQATIDYTGSLERADLAARTHVAPTLLKTNGYPLSDTDEIQDLLTDQESDVSLTSLLLLPPPPFSVQPKPHFLSTRSALTTDQGRGIAVPNPVTVRGRCGGVGYFKHSAEAEL